MRPLLPLLPCSVFFVFVIALPLAAADPAAGEIKLREALRDTMLQLRAAQGDIANLQAAQTALADEKKTLAEKYEALKKQTAAEHAAMDKTAGNLSALAAEQKAEIGRLKETLEKTNAELQKTADAGRAAEAQRAKLSVENNVLQRKVADREAKNLALFMVGNEILTRYEDFSLGNALAAKEPFVGTTRVRLENLMQDYEDRLTEQRMRP